MSDKYTRSEPPATETLHYLKRSDGGRIAYHHLDGERPGVVFLGGFRSDMTGTKATALHAHCSRVGRSFVRFDYRGHGSSSGDFLEGTIGQWADDAVHVLDRVTEGPQVLVGSSMGGWIMLLAALARPDRVAGLIGIAAAPDFTEELMWGRYGREARKALFRDGVYFESSAYDDQPYPITLKLIEEGRRHLLLKRPIAIHCPVRLFHGMKDEDVPWITASRIAERLLAEDVKVILIKDGDHRLSRERDLARLFVTVDDLCAAVRGRAGPRFGAP